MFKFLKSIHHIYVVLFLLAIGWCFFISYYIIEDEDPCETYHRWKENAEMFNAAILNGKVSFVRPKGAFNMENDRSVYYWNYNVELKNAGHYKYLRGFIEAGDSIIKHSFDSTFILIKDNRTYYGKCKKPDNIYQNPPANCH